MNIREISVSRLREYENNPRNNDLAVEKVKYSIERFGFLFPVVVDLNYTIVCGHTRIRACRELGIMSVPCIIADELTDEQINLFRLVDNKTSEYSDWDFEKLKEELSQVDLTLEKNQLLLERFELSAEVFDIEPEQAEIRVPAFNFMSANKLEASKKPVVHTNTGSADELEPIAEKRMGVPVAEEYAPVTAENASEVALPTATEEYVSAGVPASEGVAEAKPSESEPARQSKGTIPFCQFRFGDVAFFISQVELDKLNVKYAEYIDSGEILKGSFASYLLKGVEKSD